MKNLGFWIISIFLFLIITEILTGIAFWIKDVRNELISLESTKDAPYIYYTFKEDSSKGINKHGFSTKVQINKPSDKYRIALIGGSVARSLGNSKYLEGKLRTYLRNENVEVLNAALQGYVVEQEFIITQLVVQKYKPDIIIGLDGYNDLMTFNLNRFDDSYILLPPQNYRDFKVINQGKKAKKFTSRFTSLFRNINRTYHFISRAVAGNSYSDYSNISDKQLDIVAEGYFDILNDTKDFCEIKGIKYYGFLQPIRFYAPKQPGWYRGEKNEGKTILSNLYHKLENKIKETDWSYTLSSVFDDNQEVYTDDCHVIDLGNEMLAEEISRILIKHIRSDSNYLKLK